MHRLTKIGITTATIAALGACGSDRDPGSGSDTVLQPSFAPVPAECNIRGLAKSARDYFVQPEQKASTAAIADMEDACSEADAEQVWAAGWVVLATIEKAGAEVRAGDPATGAELANGLIAYLCTADPAGCNPFPEVVAEADLGPSGIFAVRGPETDDVVAHGSVSFFDFDGFGNEALWGLETTAGSWAAATGAERILFYGNSAVGTPIDPDERSFGDLQFELNSFPDLNGFATSDVHVGVCYDTEVTLPHLGGDPNALTLGERLQREETLLEAHQLSCADWWTSVAVASVPNTLGRALALVARALLPRPLAAAFMSDRKAPSTGGTPLDFSRFAPVAANPEGRLVFVVPPTDGVAGEELNTVVVQALSGEGTPIELVKVALSIDGNSGVPAGATFCDPALAELCDDPSEYTLETMSGLNTVATFNGVTLWKPGGYVICANGALNGFTFEEACAVLHIKN